MEGMLVEKWQALDLRDDTGCVLEGHAGWEMGNLRFETGYCLWMGMIVGNWLALDLRGYWLWSGMLVEKWLALDLR